MGNSQACQSIEFDKYSKVLEIFSRDRIFSVISKKDGFYIIENCDEYFSHKLTKEECEDLSELFLQISFAISRM